MKQENEKVKSLTKIIMNLVNVPILSPILTELFEYRGKIKQKRLNTFTELLENYFSNHVGVNFDNFQTEEFSDLFESVLKRVFITQSNEKMKMFKNIIVNQIESNNPSVENAEIYLNLITELTELEIKILFDYRALIKTYQFEVTELSKLERKQEMLQNRFGDSNTSINNELLEIDVEVNKKRKFNE